MTHVEMNVDMSLITVASNTKLVYSPVNAGLMYQRSQNPDPRY
jgi:hypothetical protein